MKMDRFGIEEHHSDDSGVEFGFGYDRHTSVSGHPEGAITIEHIHKIEIPIGRAQWLIDCLEKALEVHEQSDIWPVEVEAE